jgi:hypothetical protein
MIAGVLFLILTATPVGEPAPHAGSTVEVLGWPVWRTTVSSSRQDSTSTQTETTELFSQPVWKHELVSTDGGGCDRVHPARFTTIEARTGSLVASQEDRVIFRPERLDKGGCPPDVETRNIGRFRISERGELVFRFDPSGIHEAYLGRVDVRASVIDDGVAREIEVPGYRELGKPVTPSRGQAHQVESLIARVEILRSLATQRGTPKTTGDLEMAQLLLRTVISDQSTFHSAFSSIVDHPEFMSPRPPSNEDENKNKTEKEKEKILATRRLLSTATLGLEITNRSAEISESIVTQLTSHIIGVARDSWIAEYSKIGNRLRSINVDQFPQLFLMREDTRASSPADDIESNLDPEFCSIVGFEAQCSVVRKLRPLLKDKEPSSKDNLAKIRELTAVLVETDLRLEAHLSSSEALIRSSLLDRGPIHLADTITKHCRASACDALVLPSPVSAFFNGLRSIDFSDIDEAIRLRAKDVAMTGWREFRIQPRVVGANAGDVIEVTVEYTPPGLADGTPDPSGASRPASWTTRFILERQGFYVDAGATLNLVWSHEYNPTATSFRGAQGALVPGIRADVTYAPHPISTGLWDSIIDTALVIVPGAGVELNYLDFDTTKPIEIGLQAHAVVLARVFTVGVGYNFTPDDPRLSYRNMYWSIGLGVDQVFDQALKLARESSR